jgi:hypothetical protein
MKLFRKLIIVSILIVSGSVLIARILETDEKIPLSKVPKIVLESLDKALPGIIITESGIEKTYKGVVYEFEGVLEGKEYEIEISEKGKVLEIESGKNDEKRQENVDDDEDNEDDDD